MFKINNIKIYLMKKLILEKTNTDQNKIKNCEKKNKISEDRRKWTKKIIMKKKNHKKN